MKLSFYFGIGLIALCALVIIICFEVQKQTPLEFYTSPDPMVGERPYAGSSESQIYIVFVIDPLSTNVQAYEEVHSLIASSYGDQVRVYHKFYAPSDDETRIELAVKSYCVFIENVTRAWNEYDARNQIECDSGLQFAQEDVLETDYFRIKSNTLQVSIEGDDPSVIPLESSNNLINRTIRLQQIRLGI